MRTLLWVILVSGIALGGIIFAAPRLVEPPAASAIVAAACICLAAGLVALIPLMLVAPRWPDYLMQAGMGAMVIRLFLTLGVGAVYLRAYAPLKTTFMMAVVVFYLILVVAETGIAVRLVKLHWRPPKS